jgi:hypothetical protein
LVALGLYLALTHDGQPALVGDDWSAERLRQELRHRGVVYAGREVTLEEARSRGLDPGYYLKRPDDSRSWDELASLPRSPATGSMRGFVTITARLPPTFQTTSYHPQEGRVLLGKLVLHGDPAELRRILEALGYSVASYPCRGRESGAACPRPDRTRAPAEGPLPPRPWKILLPLPIFKLGLTWYCCSLPRRRSA